MRLKRDQHQNWLGEAAGYEAKHKYIRNLKGKANRCEIDTGHTNRRFEWVNLDHKYSRSPDDYVQACMQCHRQYDRGLIKIKGLTLMERGSQPMTYIGSKCLSGNTARTQLNNKRRQV